MGWRIRKEIEIKKIRTIRCRFETLTDAYECLDYIVKWVDKMGILLINGDVKYLDCGDDNCYVTITFLSTSMVYQMAENAFIKEKNRIENEKVESELKEMC